MVHLHRHFFAIAIANCIEWIVLYSMGTFIPAIWSTYAIRIQFKNGLCTHFYAIACTIRALLYWVGSISTVLLCYFVVFNVVSKMPPIQRIFPNRRHRRQFMLLYLLWQRWRVDRTMWVHPLNNMRGEKGEFVIHYYDLRQYEDIFFGMYRMSVNKFDELLQMVTPLIERQPNNYREFVSPEERLVVALT